MGDVARRLLGEPVKRLSSSQTLRWGTRGSFAANIAGAWQGWWVDFETGERGGVLNLIVRQRGGTRRDALNWLCAEGFIHARDKSSHEPPQVSAPSEREPPQDATLSNWGRRLWAACRTISADDPAGFYLLARGCALPHPDGDLRWHPRLTHPCGHEGPALVGLIGDVQDPGRWLNLHQTWVDGSGRKAALDRPRLVLKDQRKAGGVIRLWPDDAVTVGLALAEGVETCLTLARVFTPVWSTIDAGNLGAFPALPGIESVTVCVDHDPAGLRAYDALAERWTDAGREVRKVLAPTPGDDLNDWAAADADR